MPWYRFEVNPPEARSQFVVEFLSIAQQSTISQLPGAMLFRAATPGRESTFYLAPDAESFASAFIRKHRGVETAVPTYLEAIAMVGSPDTGLRLLRSPAVNLQVVEGFLTLLGLDFVPDNPSADNPWALSVSKKGSPLNIAVFRSLHQPNITLVQILAVLDGIQREALLTKDADERSAFYSGLLKTFSRGRARFGIVDPDSMASVADGDILGRVLAQIHVDVLDDELTPRSLWEAIAACVETYELSKDFVNGHLGLGLRAIRSQLSIVH